MGELLRLTASYYPQPRTLSDSAELAGVEDLLKRPYGKLSGGQQRRVQFALALCGRPRLLFLDEPTVGMDIEARRKLWDAIRALVADGCAVVLTTHYLEEAEALADRVAVMAHGRIVQRGLGRRLARARGGPAHPLPDATAVRAGTGLAPGGRKPNGASTTCTSPRSRPSRWCAGCSMPMPG